MNPTAPYLQGEEAVLWLSFLKAQKCYYFLDVTPPQKNEDLCFLAISLVKILPNPAWQVSTGLRTRKTKFSGSACTSHHDLFHLGFLIHEIKVWNSAQDPLFKKKNYGSIQNQMFVVNSSKFLPLRSLKP